ncbi:hypothetical protein RN001_003808 [Aquatica leii]|uniref:Uncharacterized protein n=1 Tax=Aquatica leii TaxID=1421715 RepID=A0AAN7SL07_9COLE|nr:hypothetical protein RN001_003808 [Aquatica leii]
MEPSEKTFCEYLRQCSHSHARTWLRHFRRRRVAKSKRIWVRQWIRNREQSGIVNNLLQELRVGDEVFYKNFLRMSAADFDYLIAKVTPFIARKDKHMRQSITPTERLTLTLRYLATVCASRIFSKNVRSTNEII